MARGQIEAVPGPSEGLRGAAMTEEATDGQLLARFAACRDELAEIAFEALVRRHGPMVLRVCHQVVGDRHAAEDAFQATFLVLSRRAGSIREPELLGNWLHGVALRTAREARMRDDRRRRREGAGGPPFPEEPVGKAPRPERELVGREELEALHEEVRRLPERYRIPVVLCDLEGMSYEEAARRLCCPAATIGVRLRRARQRLRVRLIRRGLAPTAGLLGVLLRGETATAAMATPLVHATVQAALGFGVGPGVASPAVAAIAEHVLRAMAVTTAKVALGLIVTVGVAATFWTFGHRGPRVVAAQQSPSPPREQPTPPTPRPARPEPETPSPGSGPTPPAGVSGPILAAPMRPTPSDPSVQSGPARMLVSYTMRGEQQVATAVAARVDAKPAAVPAPARPRTPAPGEAGRGEILFAREWLPDDPRGHGGDGLGPLYNDTSCVACHSLGAPGGAGPDTKNVVIVTAAPAGCGSSGSLDQFMPAFRDSRSAVLHHFSTDPGYDAWRARHFDRRGTAENKTENRSQNPVMVRIISLRQQAAPEARINGRSPQPIAVSGFSLNLVERNTPPLFGLGAVDAIPSEVLVAMADSEPKEVRGRVGRTRDGRIGRFGWKAQIPSLHEFVRVACANELGLEVPGHSQAASPLAPGSPAKGLDLTESECDDLVAYVRSLPAPVVVDPDGPQGAPDLREGRALFEEIGCATCHVPTLGDVAGIYSDLLLHEMGQSLSDTGSTYGIDGPNTPESPKPREWRTPPLWGYRDSGPYLHDGRAQNLEEAVAFHSGQAGDVTQRFFSRSHRERAQVEAFLKSLVAPSAAATPGMMLAADLESRLRREHRDTPESRMREQREAAAARDAQKWRDDRRREQAGEAAKRARVKLPIAQSLERMGKTAGAISFYNEIIQEAAGTDEARLAARRINALSTRVYTP